MDAILLDLGGTHLRLAFLEKGQIKKMVTFVSPATQEELLGHIQKYQKDNSSAKALFAAIAGPIENSRKEPGDQVVKLTNLNFSISQSDIEKRTHLKVHILNDLHALALSIPSLKKEHLHEVISGTFKSNFKQGIVSCGTGLGVAFINEDGFSTPSEAGHIEFAPTTDLEWQLLQFLKTQFPHVSYERVLSGSSKEVYLEFFKKQTAQDPNLIWWQILGRFASSVALMNLCKGGIYLAGGFFRSKEEEIGKYKKAFMDAFLDKGRLSHSLTMPVSFISHPNPELLGLQRFEMINH